MSLMFSMYEIVRNISGVLELLMVWMIVDRQLKNIVVLVLRKLICVKIVVFGMSFGGVCSSVRIGLVRSGVLMVRIMFVMLFNSMLVVIDWWMVVLLCVLKVWVIGIVKLLVRFQVNLSSRNSRLLVVLMVVREVMLRCWLIMIVLVNWQSCCIMLLRRSGMEKVRMMCYGWFVVREVVMKEGFVELGDGLRWDQFIELIWNGGSLVIVLQNIDFEF